MSESEMIGWFVIVIVPVLVSLGGLFLKIDKDKRAQENRLTRMEARVDDHDGDIDDIKEFHKEFYEYKELLIRVDERTTALLESNTRMMERLERKDDGNGK